MNQLLMATQNYALESAVSVWLVLLCDDELDCGAGLGGLEKQSQKVRGTSQTTFAIHSRRRHVAFLDGYTSDKCEDADECLAHENDA